MEKQTKILVPHGTRQELADILKCSRPFVLKSLNGVYSADSRFLKIRQLALQKGGVEIKTA